MSNVLSVDVTTPKNECHQSVSRASTEHQQSVNRASTERKQRVNQASTECQRLSYLHYFTSDHYTTAVTYNQSIADHHGQYVYSPCCYTSKEYQYSVNDLGHCIMHNPKAVWWRLHIIEVLSIFMGTMLSVDVTTPKNVRQQCIHSALTVHQHSVNDFCY